MRFRTKILNHFCRGCGTLLSAAETDRTLLFLLVRKGEEAVP